MPFFKSIKRALGFSSDEISTDETTEVLSTVERTPYINPFKNNSNNTMSTSSDDSQSTTIETPKVDVVETSIPDSITNSILDIINGSLPEIIKKSVDIDAERKYLFEKINPTFEEHIKTIINKTIQEHQAIWDDEKNSLNTKMLKMKSEYQDIQTKKEEIKNAQLSFERQKRALTDKIADLENANRKHEADIEQYILVNKGLLNKIKVYQVKYEREDMNKEDGIQATIEQLEQEIKMLENLLFTQETDYSHQSEVYPSVDAIASMINSIKKRLSNEDEDTAKDNNEIEILHQKLQLSNEELQSTREELTELKCNLEIVDEIKDQLASFDDVKKRKDERINALTQSLKQRDTEISELNNAISSLKKTIEQNVITHATTIRELTKELTQKQIESKQEKTSDTFDMEALNEIVTVTDNPTPKYNHHQSPKKKSKSRTNTSKRIISAIDDSPSGTDWLVPTPPSIDEEIKIETKPTPPEITASQATKPTSDSSQMTLF